jgi:predicted amidophosphoribosyltransferase
LSAQVERTPSGPAAPATRGAPVAPASSCAVCSRALPGTAAPCANPLCRSASRWFRWNRAIAERSGPLELALNDYKFGGDRSWAPVFGRMLAGFLMRESPVVSG